MSEDGNEAWRAFGADTEAGRTLRKLYGGPQSKPKINYPKFRTDASFDQRRAFVPAGAKVDGDVNLSLGIGVDSRSSNVKRVEVHSDYQKPHKRPAAVESLRGHGRKGRDEIMSEINATKAEIAVRRPKMTKGGDRSKAKQQLQHKFRFEGGKALPKELLMPALPKEESEKIASNCEKLEKLSEEEILFDKIVLEIEERNQFITQMNKAGDYSQNVKIKREIKDRHEELQVLKKIIDRQKNSKSKKSKK